MDYNFTVDLKLQNEVSQKIRKYFLKTEKLARSNFPKLINMLSERHFFLGIHQAAELQSAVVNSPVYFYYFTYRGAHSWHQEQIGRHEDFGSGHAEDTGFFLSSSDSVIPTETDRSMVDFFVNLFSDYANQG